MALIRANSNGGGGSIGTSYKQGRTIIDIPNSTQTATYSPSNNCNAFAVVSFVANLTYSNSGSMKVSINNNVVFNTTTQGTYYFEMLLKKGDTLMVESVSSSHSYIYYVEDYEMTSV